MSIAHIPIATTPKTFSPDPERATPLRHGEGVSVNIFYAAQTDWSSADRDGPPRGRNPDVSSGSRWERSDLRLPREMPEPDRNKTSGRATATASDGTSADDVEG